MSFEGWGHVFVFFLLSISQIFLNEQMVQSPHFAQKCGSIKMTMQAETVPTDDIHDQW